jgi:hypothetical protein
MSTINVIEPKDLIPGKRYRFTTRNDTNDDIIVEGTFVAFSEYPPSPFYNSWKFSDIVKYVRDFSNSKRSLKRVKLGNTLYVGRAPRDIHLVNFETIPDELNDLIRSFGGKSRKSKKNRNSKRRSRKSRNLSKNRKSKRR